MATVEERRARICQLVQARQEALDALLKVRLEGRNGLALGSAIERAQRATNSLFAARLDQEPSRAESVDPSGDEATQESGEEAPAPARV